MKLPTTKTTERRREIVRQLSELSRNGWQNAIPADYEHLERELHEIDEYIEEWSR